MQTTTCTPFGSSQSSKKRNRQKRMHAERQSIKAKRSSQIIDPDLANKHPKTKNRKLRISAFGNYVNAESQESTEFTIIKGNKRNSRFQLKSPLQNFN